MAKALANLALASLALIVGVAIAEFASRLIAPISPGVRYVSSDGSAATTGSGNPYRLQPNLELRQIASEYDAKLTTTDLGYRGPDAGAHPAIVFLGDSFTFGQGLSDQETFPFLVCKHIDTRCANLGRSGSGTTQQVEILEHFLNEEGWRPRLVWLFMLAMSTGLSDGNDFVDNLVYENRRNTHKVPASPTRAIAATNKQRALRTRILRHSNLSRVVFHYFAPWVRATFSGQLDEHTLARALEATKSALFRLEVLSRQHGFDYEVYVLHPIQDILRGTDLHTVETVKRLATFATVHGTAEILRHNPTRYYFSYDGHFNVDGSRALADFLLNKNESRLTSFSK